MLGLMQDWPLLCHKIIDHAGRFHGAREVVSRSVEGPIHRTDYATLRRRAEACARRLEMAGIRPGDRVATLAWNTWRHMEVWYGAMGMGGVYHTVNPRLHEGEIAWIMSHAEDRIVFADLTFVPLLEALRDRLPPMQAIVLLTDAAHMPDTPLDALAYENWLAEADGDFAWRALDEGHAAGMCYTSGTTGSPKGVVYSHRSNVLHALMVSTPDVMGLSSRDRVMPVVPMYHVNGWSLVFSGPLNGATLVMPGARLDGASLHALLEDERVTVSAGVPTVWAGLLQHLEATGAGLTHLKRLVIGGSACPRAMTRAFQERYGVEVLHAWGMTETSSLGTISTLVPEYAGLGGEALLDLQAKQGHPFFGVEMKVTDDGGRELAWDGRTFGRLKVRGPAVARSHFKGGSGDIVDGGGWLDTGDVAHIDPQGYMEITDRSRDVIKSGGEWISSIQLENIAVGHPQVLEAAVIAVPHPKWDERPLLVVVPKPGARPTREEVLDFMRPHVAKWWLPDEVVFVDEIPHTATGKIQKTALRERFAGHKLQSG